MNITIHKKSLVALLSRCTGVTKKGMLEVYSHVHLEAQGATLRLNGTDGVISIQTSEDGEKAKADGACVAPLKELLDRTKKMPDGPIQLHLSGPGLQLKAPGSSRRFILPVLGLDTLPSQSQDTPVHALTLRVWQLMRLIGRTQFSISTDESRPHVNSALLQWGEGKVMMVSTDGHRLSKDELRVDASAPGNALIPLKAIGEIRRLVEGEKPDVEVKIALSNRSIFFETAASRVGSRLVQDTIFPPYEQVIPKGTTRFRVSRRMLTDAFFAMRIAAVTECVQLSLTPGLISFSTQTADAFDEVPCTYEGAAIKVGASAKYVLDTLSAIDAEEVELGIREGGNPIEIYPLVNEDRYTSVIMPMKI